MSSPLNNSPEAEVLSDVLFSAWLGPAAGEPPGESVGGARGDKNGDGVGVGVGVETTGAGEGEVTGPSAGAGDILNNSVGRSILLLVKMHSGAESITVLSILDDKLEWWVLIL